MNKKLTSRERMRIAMSGGCPDRVPIMPQICYPHAVKIICEDYRKGMAEVVKEPGKALDLIIEISERYDVDGLRLFLPSAPLNVVDDGEVMLALHPETGERVGLIDLLGGGSLIPDKSVLPIESADDLKSIPRFRWYDLMETKPFILLQHGIKKANIRFFIASSPDGFTVNYLSERRGREQALIDLVVNRDLVKRIMDVGLENAIQQAKALVECGVDALYIGDPSSSTSLISPDHFKEFCLPRFRIFCDELHKENILIYLHICGNSTPILEMMADTGVDCIEPLDPLGGVSVADARRRVGRRVSLMGGVNTLTLLKGTPDSVYEEAITCCRAGGEDGGYILAAGDMVPDFTPEENMQAMVKAAKSFLLPRNDK